MTFEHADPIPDGPPILPFFVFVGVGLAALVCVVLSAGGLISIWWMVGLTAAFAAAQLWSSRTRRHYERLYPLGVELVPLTDSPEDGFVEERGWVPLGLAKTPEQAIELLREAYPDFEGGQEVICTGRSYHRPDLHIKGETEGYFILDKDGPEDYEGCKGGWSEWITWQKCEPDDDRAVECWDLEIEYDNDSEEAPYR